jgi:nucleoside 2-deoxyribosyltransferase
MEYFFNSLLDPVAAADLASRCVAHYAATRDTLLPVEGQLIHGKPTLGPFGRIYLAGPFFDLARRWIVEEALDRLTALGADVFSPLHEVGSGRPASEIASADLDGLRSCSAVLALLDGEDPGTLFEIGYARSIGIPVVALAENVRQGDLAMILGSGCEVVNDFATALYHAMWESGR